MPVVFAPGEVETRPLYPDQIIYTTAQKVADLLGVGPDEAVAVSADSEADRVYVTGANYRDIGFSVGDVILIYSDAQALGIEKTITAVTEGGANGVALYFTGSFGHGDYEAADNTYVQNTASFTNGKTRGMKKSIVEQRIKEIQDRIDSVTHNAWRPYLAVAEYINFDTYKPYRRRYYTDYVGTTPLLFRNVQQILRIELWQGDDYRELAGAEARLEIVDHSELTGDSVFLCPGGGGFAKLAQGTGTQQWQGAFNEITTAHNLANLINNDDRTNRGTVSFTTDATSPAGTTYTQPDDSADGVSSVYVHNEFLASANADYGGGKLKITSMQPSGGQEATIAVTDTTNISVSQVGTVEETGTIDTTPSDGARTITFTDSSSFAQYGIVRASTGTIYGYTANSGTVLSGCRQLDAGTGVTDDTAYAWAQNKLKHDLGFISGTSGDKARLKDWWLDSEMGIIYFNNSYPFFEWNAVKVSYIYGERYIEKAITEAATKLVASELLMSDDRSVLIPEGTQNVDLASKIQLWRKEADAILNRYKEVVVFE